MHCLVAEFSSAARSTSIVRSNYWVASPTWVKNLLVFLPRASVPQAFWPITRVRPSSTTPSTNCSQAYYQNVNDLLEWIMMTDHQIMLLKMSRISSDLSCQLQLSFWSSSLCYIPRLNFKCCRLYHFHLLCCGRIQIKRVSTNCMYRLFIESKLKERLLFLICFHIIPMNVLFNLNRISY